jgi:hypothetical protein
LVTHFDISGISVLEGFWWIPERGEALIFDRKPIVCTIKAFYETVNPERSTTNCRAFDSMWISTKGSQT